MFSFEGTKEANNVLEFVGKIPCDCKHRLKKPVSGSEIVGSAGIDEEARTCMNIKREETGERKGGGSLGPVSEVGEKGKKRGQIGKISASESPPQTTSRLVSLARFVFFAHADFFSPFSPNAELGPRLGRRSLLSLLSTACSGIPAPGKPSDWSDLTGYIDTFQLWVVSVTQKNRGIHDNFCSTNVFMKFPAHKDVEEGTEELPCERGTCGKDVFAIRDPADRLRQKLDISAVSTFEKTHKLEQS